MGEGAPETSEIPPDEQTTTQIQLPEARGKRSARSPAVLVVGEGEPLGESMLECMKRRGLVVAASPTERAIASAVARAPDLVVLIGDAAREGGQRTIRMLATRPTTARLPVVVLEDAAGDALDRRLRALRAGALAIVDRSASADAMAGRIADLAIFVADHGKRTAAGIDVTLDELASVVRKELGQLLPDEDGAGATMEAPGREMAEAIERFVASVRAMVRRSDPDGARLRGAPTAPAEGEAIGAADLAAFDDGATHALRGARILIVVDDAGRGDSLATELRARAATVVVSGPRPEGLARARELDPEVVLVDTDALEPNRIDVVGWLAGDPRLRWSTVIVTKWDELAPRGANVPRMPALAERIAPCRAIERDLVARAHEEARLDVDISSLGPCRALRALASVPHVLSVTMLEDPGALSIDVANGLVAGATQRHGQAGLAALARFLALPACTLHVERRRAPQSANILLPVEDALALAGRELFASLGPPEHDEIEPVTIPGTKLAPRTATAQPPATAHPPTPATAQPQATAKPPTPATAQPPTPAAAPPPSLPAPMDLLDETQDTATDVSPLRKDLPRLSIEPGALADMLEPEAAARAPARPAPAARSLHRTLSGAGPKTTLVGVAPPLPLPTMSALPAPPVAGSETPPPAREPSAASALPNPFTPRAERPAPLPFTPPLPEAFPKRTAMDASPRPPPLPARTEAAPRAAEPRPLPAAISPLAAPLPDPFAELAPPPPLPDPLAPLTPTSQPERFAPLASPPKPLPDPFAAPRTDSVAPLPDPFAAPRTDSSRPLTEAFGARPESTPPLPEAFAPAVAAAVPLGPPSQPAPARPKSSAPSALAIVGGLFVVVVLLGGAAFAAWRFVIAPAPATPIASIALPRPTPPTPHVAPPTPPTHELVPVPVPPPVVPPPVVPPPVLPPPVVPTPINHVTAPTTPVNVVETPTPVVPPTPPVTPIPTPVAETPTALDAPMPEVEQSEALTEQARALLEHHDDAAAEPLLLQAAQLGPRNPHPMEALARLYLARGDGPHAVEWAEKLVGVRHRRAAFRVLLGDARKLAGDQAGAETAWHDALGLEPDNADAHARLGE